MDFSPTTYLSVIAVCWVGRAACVLGSGDLGGWPGIPVVSCISSNLHLKNGGWKSQIDLSSSQVHLGALVCKNSMENAFKNSKRDYYYSYSKSYYRVWNLSVSAIFHLGSICKYHFIL